MLNSWINFAINTKPLLDEMMKIVSNQPIEFEEPMTVSIGEFGKNKLNDPALFFVKLSNEMLTFDDLVAHKRVYEVYLSDRTRFTLNHLGEKPYVLITDSTSNKEFQLEVTSYDSLRLWYLALTVSKKVAVDKQKATLDSFAVEEVKSQPKPENGSNSDESDQPNTDALPSKSPAIKITSDTPSQMTNKVIEKEKERSNELKREAMELEKELRSKLATYKRTFPKCVAKPEPELTPFDFGKYDEPVEKEVPKVAPQRKSPLSEGELKKLVSSRVCNPSVNFSRFAPQICLPKVDIPNVDYNPKTEIAFEEVYKESSRTDAFLLLCAIVYNGFIGNSLSDFYGVARLPGESIQAEAAKIVQTHEAALFNVFLDNPYIEDMYSADSLARDHDMIARIASIPKEFENPGVFPTPPPFCFAHRPLERFANWFYDMHYLFSLHVLDPASAIMSLTQCLYSFFTHYIAPGQVIGFFKEVASKMGASSIVGPWANIKNAANSDEWNSFVRFWVESFKDGKLLQNFVAIYSCKDIIAKYYNPCSHVRSSYHASSVASYLCAFEKMGIPANIDFVFKNEGKSIGKSLLQLVGIGGK